MRRPLLPALIALLAFAAPASAATHGDVVSSRALGGAPALTAAGKNQFVLYRSVGIGNKPVTVSGAIAVPKGKAPKGGWPIITWAHGTTGMADKCAPTRLTAGPQLLNQWLKDGFAVVRTDYEGLGTPGVHPYLNGASEGHSVLDIVRAARKLDKRLGKRVLISGHSQGGQAALFAAALAPKYTPELNVRGTVAFAPASHLSEQVPIVRALTSPSGLTALAMMIARGLDLSDPSLDVPSLLTDKVRALYPSIDTSCLGDLGKSDSYGGIAPSEIFRDDANLDKAVAALNRIDDPENLTIKTPLRIEQGTADTTVLPLFTDQLNTELTKRGTKVVYKKYDGVNHGTVVTAKAPTTDATKYIRSRLK